MTIETPLRTPDTDDTRLMAHRSWWLLVMHIVFPGSPQLVAGKRKMGRIGCGVTLGLIAVGVIALLLYATNRALLLTLATNRIAIVLAQILVVAYGVFWLVYLIDTLRLIRLAKVHGKTKIAVAMATVLAMVSSVAAVAGVVHLTAVQSQFVGNVFSQVQMADPVDGRYNILLLGVDSGKGRDHILPDSITVMSINAESGQAALIGIPRDLKNVKLSADSPLNQVYTTGLLGDGNDKMNAAYTRGTQHADLYPDAEENSSSAGVEATKDAAEGVTGLTIQYYVIIDMRGFADLIDALGGVTIDVKKRVTKTKGKKIYGYIEPGVQVMDGNTALWFARVRKDGSNDWGRMERQRLLQKAIIKQFKPAVVLTKFQEIADAGEQLVETDVPEGALGGFLDLALKMQQTDQVSLELSPPAVDQTDPNYDEVHELVQEALAEASPASPSPEAQ